MRPARLEFGVVETASNERARLLTPGFALITIAALAYFTSYAALIPTLPRYVKGPLGGSSVAVGIAVGSFAVTALLLRPVAGAIADRRGRKLLVTSGSLLVVAATGGMTGAHHLLAVIALRLLAGAGEAFFFVGAVRW